MPFKEIKPLTNYIRVHRKGITISVSLVKEYFDGKRIKLFHDEKEKLVGLKPSDEGYKLTNKGGGYIITCAFLTRVIKEGTYFPAWSNRDEMLIFGY